MELSIWSVSWDMTNRHRGWWNARFDIICLWSYIGDVNDIYERLETLPVHLRISMKAGFFLIPYCMDPMCERHILTLYMFNDLPTP